MNHNLIADHRATFHSSDVCPNLVVLVRSHDEHLIAIRSLAQSADRDRHDLVWGTHRDLNTDRRAGGGSMVSSFDSGAHHG